MKKLNLYLLSDIHSPDYFRMMEINPDEFDVVLTLGDIDSGTIDYILFKSRWVKVFGIYGNHDPKEIPGVTALDKKIVEVNGFKISGVSGVNKYYSCFHSYSERKVKKKLKKIGYVDILISHSPPYSVSKDEDLIHRGFKAIDDYILKFSPKYVIYGHLGKKQKHLIGTTEVIGTTGKDFLKIEEK